MRRTSSRSFGCDWAAASRSNNSACSKWYCHTWGDWLLRSISWLSSVSLSSKGRICCSLATPSTGPASGEKAKRWAAINREPPSDGSHFDVAFIGFHSYFLECFPKHRPFFRTFRFGWMKGLYKKEQYGPSGEAKDGLLSKVVTIYPCSTNSMCRSGPP